jgi:hypothetical protein
MIPQDSPPGSPHLICTAHSGLDLKTNILITLSSLALLLLSVNLSMLISMKTEVALSNYRVQTISVEVAGLKDRILNLERLANENNKYNLQMPKEEN